MRSWESVSAPGRERGGGSVAGAAGVGRAKLPVAFTGGRVAGLAGHTGAGCRLVARGRPLSPQLGRLESSRSPLGGRRPTGDSLSRLAQPALVWVEHCRHPRGLDLASVEAQDGAVSTSNSSMIRSSGSLPDRDARHPRCAARPLAMKPVELLMEPARIGEGVARTLRHGAGSPRWRVDPHADWTEDRPYCAEPSAKIAERSPRASSRDAPGQPS